MRSELRRAFTLIELLTVIAIIAVLVAILFPVYSRIKESGRQATCLSNMRQLFVGASQYRDEYGDYPPLLLGPAEGADGLPYLEGSSTLRGPAGDIQNGYLYPRYVKNIDVFHCPNNPERSQTSLTTAVFPANTPFTGPAVFGAAGLVFGDMPPAYAGQPVTFYAFDSYDITAGLDADGKRAGFVLAYAKDWTGGEGPADPSNQLKYPSPPTDRTLLTYCNYHVAMSGTEVSPIVLLSGTAKTVPYKRLQQQSWDAFGTP